MDVTCHFRPMKDAPTDRAIKLHMPDGSAFKATSEPFDEGDKTVWGWVAANEGEAPEDWHDGVCWAQNENGKPSTRPVGWSDI